jgi:hypothetical protein
MEEGGREGGAGKGGRVKAGSVWSADNQQMGGVWAHWNWCTGLRAAAGPSGAGRGWLTPSACTPNALMDSLAFRISIWASSCIFSSFSRAFSAGGWGDGGVGGVR